MKPYHKITSILLLASTFCGYAQSDSLPDEQLSIEQQKRKEMIASTHIITEGGEVIHKDSIEKLINRFYVDQFRHFQDPRAPYFMFMSKDSNFALGVGGLVRMRGYFDWDGSIPASGFSPYMIPIPKNPENEKNLWATPAGTGLFLTLLGKNTVLGNFMAYVQADFSGYNNRDFKIKKAYIQTDHWTAGYAKTTFEDTSAEPPTIDGAGPNGVNSRTNVLVRYITTFKNKWTVAASFEFPKSSIAADGTNTKACADFLPDLAAFAQYQWDGGESHIRLSGLIRVLSYRNLLQEKNHSIVGWGAQLSTTLKICRELNLFGIASIGQGHESYTTDLAGGSFDLVSRPEDPGKLYAPTATGFVLGARYYFTPKVFSCIALSEQRYYPKVNPDDSQYKYGLYGALNVFWDITPRFELGAEYLAGKRMNFNGEHDNANRITAMMMFSF